MQVPVSTHVRPFKVSKCQVTEPISISGDTFYLGSSISCTNKSISVYICFSSVKELIS